MILCAYGLKAWSSYDVSGVRILCDCQIRKENPDAIIMELQLVA